MALKLLAIMSAAVCVCACARAHAKDVAPIALHKRIDHITIVIMENHSFNNIIGNPQAPYINKLAKENMLFTNSYALTHPSEPNYLALYSGSTHGLTSDACPVNFNGPSLGGRAVAAHKSMKGYMEDLPSVGAPVCEAGEYVRKHNPLIDFADTPAGNSVPYRQIIADLTSKRYPAIAFVVPNMLHDMHDGTIAMGDAWLARNLQPILSFDAAHRGMLILTWDEDRRDADNHIVTIVAGPMVRTGQNGQPINHYSVLRTVTDLFGLQALDDANPIAELTH